MREYQYIEIDNSKNNQNTLMEHRYYSVLRPISIGTYPNSKRNHFTRFINYDERKEVRKGLWAWGEIYYRLPLTDEEIYSYDLAI